MPRNPEFALQIYARMPLEGDARVTDKEYRHIDDLFCEDHEQTIRAAFRATGVPAKVAKNLFAAESMRAYRKGKRDVRPQSFNGQARGETRPTF